MTPPFSSPETSFVCEQQEFGRTGASTEPDTAPTRLKWRTGKLVPMKSIWRSILLILVLAAASAPVYADGPGSILPPPPPPPSTSSSGSSSSSSGSTTGSSSTTTDTVTVLVSLLGYLGL